MIAETLHNVGVRSRTHKTCFVQEPVTVTIGGISTELSLDDAQTLLTGLQEAIERVSQNEKRLMGDGSDYHVAIIGSTSNGMSIPRSRLG